MQSLALCPFPNHMWHVILMHNEAKVKTVKDNLVFFDRYPCETLLLQTKDEHLLKCTNLSLLQISDKRFTLQSDFDGLKIFYHFKFVTRIRGCPDFVIALTGALGTFPVHLGCLGIASSLAPSNDLVMVILHQKGVGTCVSMFADQSESRAMTWCLAWNCNISRHIPTYTHWSPLPYWIMLCLEAWDNTQFVNSSTLKRTRE